MQLGEDRRVPICRKVDVIASLLTLKQASLGKLFQLPLDGADTSAHEALNLPKIKTLFRAPIQKGKHITPYSPEKKACYSVRLSTCYHIGYNCNLSGYAGQVERCVGSDSRYDLSLHVDRRTIVTRPVIAML